MSALRYTRGLTWPPTFDQHRQKTGELDILDWLRAMFGFQASLMDCYNRESDNRINIALVEYIQTLLSYLDIYRGTMSGTKESI